MKYSHDLFHDCLRLILQDICSLAALDSGAQEKAKQHGAIATLGVGRTAPQGWTDGEFIHEELKGVTLPDVTKGLGDNKAAKATGYLMFNEYVFAPLICLISVDTDRAPGTLPTTWHSCD